MPPEIEEQLDPLQKGEESLNQTSNEINEENKDNSDTSKNEDKKNEIKDETFETAKESTGGKYDTLTLIKDVAKLEAKIENEKSKSIDEDQFYSNLNKYLTDDELQLRFDDNQSKYLVAVKNAKDKWLKENSIDTTEEEKELAVVKGNLIVSQAIDEVLKDVNYKDFNFTKLQEFYHNDLTKKEQAELDKGSSKDNLAIYFKKIHDEYKKRNPKIVKNIPAPNIPDMSNASRSTVEDVNQLEQDKSNKEYRSKIGFRKL